jgi:periplasmic copper chaperone A
MARHPLPTACDRRCGHLPNEDLTMPARFILPLTALLALAGAGEPAQAHDYKAGGLTISHPWIRATPKGAAVAGGFVTITNTGAATDRLVGAGVTGASRAEVHATTTEGGVARMAPVEGGLEIKPGETVKLAPGGYHLMLMGLKGSFVDGELIEGTLQFQNAGRVPVEFEVQSVGAQAPAHSHRR